MTVVDRIEGHPRRRIDAAALHLFEAATLRAYGRLSGSLTNSADDIVRAVRAAIADEGG